MHVEATNVKLNMFVWTLMERLCVGNIFLYIVLTFQQHQTIKLFLSYLLPPHPYHDGGTMAKWIALSHS